MPKTVDEFVNDIVALTVGLVIIGVLSGEPKKQESPRHKPKGKWRTIKCLKDAY